MKRLTKSHCLFELNCATEKAIQRLQNQGLNKEAYFIVNARNKLTYALLDSVKDFKHALIMSIVKEPTFADENLYYIYDNYTRTLFIELANTLGIKY